MQKSLRDILFLNKSTLQKSASEMSVGWFVTQAPSIPNYVKLFSSANIQFSTVTNLLVSFVLLFFNTL